MWLPGAFSATPDNSVSTVINFTKQSVQEKTQFFVGGQKKKRMKEAKHLHNQALFQLITQIDYVNVKNHEESIIKQGCGVGVLCFIDSDSGVYFFDAFFQIELMK